MRAFLADCGHGLRLLRKSPRFAAVAVTALAVGLGANLTIFGFASALLLRAPSGVANPGQVVRVYTSNFSATAVGNYTVFRDRNTTFTELAAFRPERVSVRTSGAPEQLFGFAVTGNYFQALGVLAAVGRPLGPADDEPGASGAVVLSDRFWRTRFGGDRQVIGRSFPVNGREATIVGVAPREFTTTMAPLVPDFWMPMRLSRRLDTSVQIMGRLRPDVSVARAEAELTAIAAQLAAAASANPPRAMMSVYQARVLAPELAMPAAIFAIVLLAVVGLVLLIACVNIANLLLARSAARQREIGVRLALGASRGRLVRQLLTESLVLAVAGALAAVVVAWIVGRPIAAALSHLPGGPPVALDFTLDWRVTAAAVALSLLTTLGFGLMPALQSSRRGVVPALREGASSASPKRSRMRGLFVSAQAALSTLLLVVAALLIRAVFSAERLDRGFVADGVLAASVDLQSAGYTPERGRVFYARLLERLATDSAVTSATIVDMVPLMLSNTANLMVKDGGAEPVLVYSNAVSPGHFRTLGIPLLAGRDFDERDRETSPLVVIVNETLARRFWPGANPIGQRLRVNDSAPASPWLEVVGLARNSKYVTVGEEPRPFLYQPMAQAYTPAGTILLKGAGSTAGALVSARAAVQAIDPSLPLFAVAPLDSATSVSLLPVKIAATVAGVLGALALVLGAIGLYGVMSAIALQRTREIGIRMALGAQAGAVVRLVTSNGMRWTAMGIVLGLAAAYGVASAAAGFLYGVSALDPAAFATIPVVLATAAYTACYLPARRASRLDPLRALRDE